MGQHAQRKMKMALLSGTSEIHAYPVIEGLDCDLVIFPALDHTFHIKFFIIQCKAGFLRIQRVILSLHSLSLASAGRELFLQKWPSLRQSSWLQGAGKTRGLLSLELGQLLNPKDASLLFPFRQGPDSKATGINLHSAEPRTKPKGLEWASGNGLKGMFYSKRNDWGIVSSLSVDFENLS